MPGTRGIVLTVPPRRSTTSRPMIAIDRPIAALDQHIRLQRRDQIERVRLGKDDDVVDAGQRGKHFRAVGFSHDRPIGRLVQALARTYRC